LDQVDDQTINYNSIVVGMKITGFNPKIFISIF
jgi:hypothetical protein